MKATDTTCPKGHADLRWIEGDYPSGVESLGYREYLHDAGRWCETCNHLYDESDVEGEGPTRQRD